MYHTDEKIFDVFYKCQSHYLVSEVYYLYTLFDSFLCIMKAAVLIFLLLQIRYHNYKNIDFKTTRFKKGNSFFLSRPCKYIFH